MPSVFHHQSYTHSHYATKPIEVHPLINLTLSSRVVARSLVVKVECIQSFELAGSNATYAQIVMFGGEREIGENRGVRVSSRNREVGERTAKAGVELE